MRKLWQSLKTGSAGLSLVELIISLAILAVVGTAVGGAMYISSRSYTRSAAEVNVQEEAQVACNLISDWLIDATKVDPEDSSDPGVTDFTTLKITHPEGNKEVEIEIYLSGSSLMYKAKDVAAGSYIGEGVLASNVTGVLFQSTFKDNRNVTISMDFSVNGRTYHSVTDTSSRSQSFVSTGSAFTPGSPVLYVPDNDIYLEPGQNEGNHAEYSFDAIIYGVDPSEIESFVVKRITASTGSNSISDGDITIKVSHPDDYPANKYMITCEATNNAMTGTNGVLELECVTSYGSVTQPLNINIRRATKCEFNVEEIEYSDSTFSEVQDGFGNTLYYKYNAPITVDLGLTSTVGDTGSAFDRGAIGYKDPSSVKFYYLYKDGSTWKDASSWIDTSAVVTSGSPSMELRFTTVPSKDIYVIAVAEHSGWIPADGDIGNLVGPNVAGGINIPSELLTDATYNPDGRFLPNNKVTYLNANIVDGNYILDPNKLYTYTNTPADGGNVFSGPSRAYVDCFVVKAGGSHLDIIHPSTGFRRGTRKFTIGAFSSDFQTQIENTVDNYAACNYSVVLRYKKDVPGAVEQYFVVSTYDWDNFHEKVPTIDSYGNITGNREGVKLDAAQEFTTVFDMDASYSISVQLYAYDPSLPRDEVNWTNPRLISSADTSIPAVVPYIADPGQDYKFKTNTYDEAHPLHIGNNDPKNIYGYFTGWDNEDNGNYEVHFQAQMKDEHGIWQDVTLIETENKDKFAGPVIERYDSYWPVEIHTETLLFSSIVLNDGQAHGGHDIADFMLAGYDENACPDPGNSGRNIFISQNSGMQPGHDYRLAFNNVSFQQHHVTSGTIGVSNGTVSSSYDTNYYDLSGSGVGYIYIHRDNN